jgi:hypothetical protein
MLALTLAAATLALVMTALAASAQTQQLGASSLHVQLKNATPIETAACKGRDAHCPAGSHWVCGPYGQRCWCTPC